MNDGGITGVFACFDRLHGADGEEGVSIEGEPRNAKLAGHFINPREQKVSHNAIWRVVLYKMLNLLSEHHDGLVDLERVGEFGDGGEILNAVRKADFSGGEWDCVKVEVVGRDGFVNELGVGGSGDDGHMVAA